MGVCTRPADSCALYLQVKARVTFNPTSQSASERACADAYRLSNSFAGRNLANPSRIALSVCEEIQRRRAGLFQPAFFMIQRATSSPSRPASVAIISSETSLRRIRPCTTLNCRPVWPITTSFICCGSMGRVSMSHFSHAFSYTSGSASVTKWPSAHVTMYFSPSRYPSRLQPKTRANSFPTDGFSANTNAFAILKAPFTCSKSAQLSVDVPSLPPSGKIPGSRNSECSACGRYLADSASL